MLKSCERDQTARHAFADASASDAEIDKFIQRMIALQQDSGAGEAAPVGRVGAAPHAAPAGNTGANMHETRKARRTPRRNDQQLAQAVRADFGAFPEAATEDEQTAEHDIPVAKTAHRRGLRLRHLTWLVIGGAVVVWPWIALGVVFFAVWMVIMAIAIVATVGLDRVTEATWPIRARIARIFPRQAQGMRGWMQDKLDRTEDRIAALPWPLGREVHLPDMGRSTREGRHPALSGDPFDRINSL